MREQGAIHLHWSWENRKVRIFLNASSWGPGFLAVVWFGSSPTPNPPPVSELSLFLSLPMCRRSSLLTGNWEEPMKQWQESLVLYKSFSARWLHCFFAQAQIYTLLIIRSSQSHRILVAKLWPITNRLAIVPELSFAGFLSTRADLLAQPLILSSRMLIII
jgi:hypothetical protein